MGKETHKTLNEMGFGVQLTDVIVYPCSCLWVHIVFIISLLAREDQRLCFKLFYVVGTLIIF